MNGESSAEKQLSEISEVIAEARSQSSGGGIVALVWAILLAAAFATVALRLVHNSWYVWAAHNCLGWAFTLVWFRRESRVEGRVSLRGMSMMKLWAAVTLALWLCVWTLLPYGAGLVAVMSVLVGIGIFGTGLISECTFSQILGVLLMLAGPVIFAFVPSSAAWVFVGAALVVIGIVWGAGTWLVKERR